MAPPLAFLKLGTMAFKILAKPIANGIKDRAKEPGTIRNMCFTVGNFYHKANKVIGANLIGSVRVRAHC
jgi:hypothetical protein